MDVVFHVTAGDRDAVERAVGNAENLLADETVDVGSVALVANGDAVAHLGAGGDLATDVTVLLDRGVAVKACGNTLERRGESQTDLVVGVEVVASAMGELARLQEQGYAYIRS